MSWTTNERKVKLVSILELLLFVLGVFSNNANIAFALSGEPGGQSSGSSDGAGEAKPEIDKNNATTITFDRELSGDKVGQHKAPPLSLVGMKITATTSSPIENGVLIDYYPVEWTISDANSGNVSPYNTIYNKIEWNVGTVNESVSQSYVVFSPQRTLPPTKYYFFSEFSGKRSDAWMVIVSDPSPALILFWDGDTIPSGWTCISCVPGDPFYQRFPRGNDTYGITGGSAHTHTLSWVSTTGPSAIAQYDDSGGTTNYSSSVHIHGLASYTVSEVLPPYRNLKVIRYDAGIPSTLPAGVIAIFNTTSLPSGWTAYALQDNYFARGEGAIATGGSNTHSVSVTSAANTTSIDIAKAASATGELLNHTHTGSGTSGSASRLPPYIEVVFANASSDTSIPNGMIAMFNETPSADWEVVSASGKPFYLNFLKGNSTAYGATGGAETHNHSNLNVTLSATTNTFSTADVAPLEVGADVAHTHTMTVSFSTNSTIPPYISVIFAYKKPDTTPPTVAVQSPTNTTYDVASVWVNVTLNEDTGNVTAQLDAATNYSLANSSGNWNYLLTVSDGAHNVRIFANDSSGNMNSSQIVYFTVVADNPPYRVDIQFPANNTWNASATINVGVLVADDRGFTNLTLRNASAVLAYNSSAVVNGSVNVLTYAFPADGIYLVYANATDNATTPQSNRSVNWTVKIDATPPRWYDRNQHVSSLYKGEDAKVYARWADNVQLANATLSHNASGSWANVSTIYLGGVNTWSNFTINTLTTWTPGIKTWKIYANDTVGNENVTDEKSFELWGWSNISWIAPDDGTYSLGTTVKLVAQVRDANSSAAIGNYTVEFYNVTATTATYLGQNNTNSSGYAVWYWNTSGLAKGTYYPKANITNNATMYYNASADNRDNTTITLVTDITPPGINITSPRNETYYVNSVDLNYSVNETTSWEGYSLDGRANVTLTGNTTLMNIGNGSHNVTVYANDTAGNMGSSMVWFTISVSDITPPTITITNPANETEINILNDTVTGTVTDDVGIAQITLALNGTVVHTWSSAGDFSKKVNYTANASAEITVTAKDTSENIASKTIVVEVRPRMVSKPVTTTANVPEVIDVKNETNTIITLTTVQAVSGTINVTACTNTSAVGVDSMSSYGLAQNQHSLNKYIKINVSDNLNATSGNISWVITKLYYSDADLDRTGDGDANDPSDINEQSLKLYWYCPNCTGNQKWFPVNKGNVLVSKGGPVVYEADVDMTNNYVWANLSHFSVYGLAGDERGEEVGVVPGAGGGGGGGGGVVPVAPPALKEGVNILTPPLMEKIMDERNLRGKPFCDAPLPLAAPMILVGEYPVPTSPLIQGTLVYPVKSVLKPSNAVRGATVVDLGAVNEMYDIAAEKVLRKYAFASAIIIARGDNPVDSMAAIAYAKQKDLPILLTRPNELPEPTLNAIQNLKPNKIIVIGGPMAVSTKVENRLKEIAYVERIWGETRHETTVEIASKIDNFDTIVITGGENPSVDALIVAAEYGAPLLYVTGSNVPQRAEEFIVEHKTTKVVIVDVDRKVSTEIQVLMALPRFLTRHETVKKLYQIGTELLG
ncbi:MAG: cell wall-binding repeat-containing protein [Methanobacteriota archaeon]